MGRMGGFHPAIGRAFNFTAEELAENREGRLTADQELIWRHSVRAWERGTGRGARMLGLGIAAAVAVGEARFGIDRLQEESLETGGRYRMHYLPSDGAAWVLSIERIPVEGDAAEGAS